MKTKILLLVSFIFICNFTYAQSEIETLEKMYRMVENDRESETQAQELVQNYYYNTKDKIRENSGKLTKEEYNDLSKYQNIFWKQITDTIRDYYSGSYSKFYSQQRKLLEQYREGILDRLYKYIYN